MAWYAGTRDGLYIIVGVTSVLVTSLVLAFKITYALRTFLLCRIFPPTLKRRGGWAVVTGSTDGIGKEYARELAARGFNLVLISRTQQKLNATAAEFEDTYGVETITIQTDFGLGKEIYPSIRDRLRGLDIDMLVNNVGALGNHPCSFLDLSPYVCVECLNTNILSTVMMSQIVVPRMIEKRHGYVVNVSSLSSAIPLPLLSLYSSSKAFVTWLSQSLGFEYEDKGIVFQSVIPSYVSTKLVKFSEFLQGESLFVPDAPTYVRSAIDTVTVSKVTTGFWIHGLIALFIDVVPRDISLFANGLKMKFLMRCEKQCS